MDTKADAAHRASASGRGHSYSNCGKKREVGTDPFRPQDLLTSSPARRYVASQNSGLESNHQKLDAALRLGIKLAVVDAIGSELGIGALSLLMGFAFDRFARLSFSSLSLLRAEAMSQDLVERLSKFSDRMALWWKAQREEYHACFGDASSGPVSSTADSTIRHRALSAHGLELDGHGGTSGSRPSSYALRS